ncbi:hypothetical protein HUJ04_007670 [Dendroctonus ponderosae]|nr:hypothetical protein HUJ04_007670 [Dendroctonus ponderosae]KAH1025769.1 hypothetical protein HUJ05_010428 [Dendroctonus ponderosae]
MEDSEVDLEAALEEDSEEALGEDLVADEDLEEAEDLEEDSVDRRHLHRHHFLEEE